MIHVSRTPEKIYDTSKDQKMAFVVALPGSTIFSKYERVTGSKAWRSPSDRDKNMAASLASPIHKNGPHGRLEHGDVAPQRDNHTGAQEQQKVA